MWLEEKISVNVYLSCAINNSLNEITIIIVIFLGHLQFYTGVGERDTIPYVQSWGRRIAQEISNVYFAPSPTKMANYTDVTVVVKTLALSL